MADYEHLGIETGDGVATVTFARPDARNALNAGLIGEIRRSMQELAEDDDVRVVDTDGRGRLFLCGGGHRIYAGYGGVLL